MKSCGPFRFDAIARYFQKNFSDAIHSTLSPNKRASEPDGKGEGDPRCDRARGRATVTTMAAKEMKRSAIQHTAAQPQCPKNRAHLGLWHITLISKYLHPFPQSQNKHQKRRFQHLSLCSRVQQDISSPFLNMNQVISTT